MTSEMQAISTSLYAKKLVAFLEKQGLDRRAQTELIKELLEISESQAYRKLKADDNGWTLHHLHKVAAHFKVSFDQLFSTTEAVQHKAHFLDGIQLEDAQLHLWQHLPCKIKLGSRITDQVEPPPLVAQIKDDGWHVFQMPPSNEEAMYAVDFVFASIPEPTLKVRKPTVAIVDDTDADLLAQVLQLHNLDVTAYPNPGDFLLAVEHKPYDVYVLDWVLGLNDSGSIIDIIRNLYGEAPPIIVFTGFAQEHEVELGRALAKANVHYAGKPMPTSILAMQIHRTISKVVLPAHERS